MKKYGILDGVPLRTTHAHAVSIMLLQIRKYMFKDWDISCLQGMIGTYHDTFLRDSAHYAEVSTCKQKLCIIHDLLSPRLTNKNPPTLVT